MVDELIANFDGSLTYYEREPPFKGTALAAHRRTINLRRKLGSASAALADNEFLKSLSETLNAWDVGRHDTILAAPNEFSRQLRKHASELASLESILIDQADAATGDRVWRVIRSLDIVLGRKNLKPTQSKIVGGSKALHHILPELVVPIDRRYSGFFLLRSEPRYFQNGRQEAETFRLAFEAFRAIASKVNLAQHVGRHDWNTSRTKVIDNAVVGFVRYWIDTLSAETAGR